MDFFYEGGNIVGVDFDVVGKVVMKVMKKVNLKVVWVVQVWQVNLCFKMIENLKVGDLLIFDLISECCLQWGDFIFEWYCKNGYGQYDWIYCMFLNYGGNVGLYGKMDNVIDNFYFVKVDLYVSVMLKGVGMIFEGIENNLVMYELVMELFWCFDWFMKEEWLKEYVKVCYGVDDLVVQVVWINLVNFIYNLLKNLIQQGIYEFVFCVCLVEDVYQVFSWLEMKDYYCLQEVIEVVCLMVFVVDCFKGNNNFEYDLVDIVCQVLVEKGCLMQKVVIVVYCVGDK